MTMEKREIIAQRMKLLTDILGNMPDVGPELFSALSEEESGALLTLLDKLTGQAEQIFYRQQEQAMASMPPLPDVELADNEAICIDCEQYCKVSWDEAGNIEGPRCALGYKAAKQLMQSGR